MPQDRQSAVSEMKRILKPKGQIYLSIGGPLLGYVSKTERETILGGFRVERGGTFKEEWAVVSLK